MFAIESALGLIFISESGAISSAVGITSPSHALFEWVVQEGIDLRGTSLQAGKSKAMKFSKYPKPSTL